MLALAKRIGLHESVITELEKLIRDENKAIDTLAEKCITNGFHILKAKSPMMVLAVILKLAVDVKAEYDRTGIDEKIYYDTMSDIKIWCEKTGNKGIREYMWLRNHVKFELFRLGRLQFQLYECKNKTLLYKKLPFSRGDKLINVHIPEGERLDETKCLESFAAAERFFSEFFPGHKYEYYLCESWLIFEGNRDFMKDDSNIVKFMNMFEHCYSVKIDAQAIERIYGKRKLFKKNCPENTDLQRRAKDYMLKGNKLGIGVGVKRKDITATRDNKY